MKASFPFAALALLITAFASVLVCTDVDSWRENLRWLSEKWPWRALAFFGGAAVFGAVVGAFFMFSPKLSWRARLMAPVTGIIASEIGVLVLAAPGPIWRTIFAVLVLLSTAIVFRLGAE